LLIINISMPPHEEKLAEALGLPEPLVRQFRDIVVPDNAKEDIKKVRQNLYEMMIRSADGIEELMDIAATSRHPRSFEAMALLMKSNLEAARDLADLEKKRLETEKLRGEGAKQIDDIEMTSVEFLHSIKEIK
jgi:hypothetical protein